MHAGGEHIHVDDVVAAAKVYLATVLRLANHIAGLEGSRYFFDEVFRRLLVGRN